MTAGLELQNLLDDVARKLPAPDDGNRSLLADVDAGSGSHYRISMLDEFERIESKLSTIFFQTVASDLLDTVIVVDSAQGADSSQNTPDSGDSEAGQVEAEDDKESAAERQDRWRKSLADTLHEATEISKLAFETVLDPGESVTNPKARFVLTKEFFEDTTWPLLMNCVAVRHIRGPQKNEYEEILRASLDSKYPEYQQHYQEYLRELRKL